MTETQKIFVYAKKGSRFFCEDEDFFTVTVSQTPQLPVFEDTESCGEYTLANLSTADDEVTYFWTSNTGEEMVANEYTINEPGTYNIYVLANAKSNDECFVDAEFELTIYPLLEIDATASVLCRNAETGEVDSPGYIYTGIDPKEFEVNWYYNGSLVHTGADYEAMQAGTYTIMTTKLYPEVGAECNYAPAEVEVLESGVPIVDVNVSQPFSDIANVEVNVVQGFGSYEYRLDDGEYQSSNVFQDVDSGKHLVYVRGVGGGCGEAVMDVTVVKYPKYFTPNQDGYNDTWNITSLKEHTEAEIHIFDRYGKLLKKISPAGRGWDGIYNSNNLPSDDYWFKVSYVDEQQGLVEFAAHFSLKR
tara:strand:- start:1003 stop:2082 length:1080 start_codon:yes stop_codon:yes gene_type:complete